GAAAARGDVLIFLNDDTEVITGDWLARLAALATRPGVGPVGAMLLYEDDTIQHMGVVLRNQQVEHLYRGAAPATPSYLDWLSAPPERAAVTGACMAISRAAFDALEGFDPRFPVLYNDIDLCLRARRRGWRTIVEPRARLYHFERRSIAPPESA